jgi:hypothetical protein
LVVAVLAGHPQLLKILVTALVPTLLGAGDRWDHESGDDNKKAGFEFHELLPQSQLMAECG